MKSKLILACCAVAWLALALLSSLHKSAAIDEIPHLAAGLSALQYRDFRMNPEHPPLIKELAAFPVYLFCRPDMAVQTAKGEIGPWMDSLQTEYGYYLLFMAGKPPERMLLLARIVPALVGLLGGLFAFWWGREIAGRAAGGYAAAFLLLTYPEYIGHARFLALDVPTLVACGAVSWMALKWRQKPCWKTAIALAVTAAIGSQIKLPVTVFSAFTLATLAGCALLGNNKARMIPRVAAVSLLLFVSIVFAMWASSDFRFSHTRPGMKIEARGPYIPSEKSSGDGLQNRLVEFAWKHHLLPETALATINHTASFGAREMFLLGQGSLTGFYSYFFITFLAKTPLLMTLGIIALAVAGLRRLIRPNRSRVERWRIERAMLLLIPFALLFALYVKSRPNIGHRQILFIYFPLTVFLGAATSRWLRAGGKKRLAAIGLIVAQIANVAAVFPNYETYFNELIRTPYRGSRIVLDSNVDWGEDVPSLAAELKELDFKGVNYAVFGCNKPASWGIPKFRWLVPNYPHAVYMPEAQPPDPAWPSAISLNLLGFMRSAYPRLYAREPDFMLNSIALYLPGNPLHNR